MDIPKNWTFKSKEIAKGFTDHVREQLPWYDLVTKSVVNFGRHYIPKSGTVYDIGASTGNIGNALREVIEDRNAKLIAIEESKEMVDQYTGPGDIVNADAIDFPYKPFDFCVLFLVLMFIPLSKRSELIRKLVQALNPGGCIVIVDKINTPEGYFGTAMRRLTMQVKIDNGANPEDVIKKELSLAGYQRPVDASTLPYNAKTFFQFGEFAGWVIESSFDEWASYKLNKAGNIGKL